MQNKRKVIVSFLLGAAAMLLLFLLFKGFSKKNEETQNDYFIITNQIRKMNKMVVMEQDLSTLYSSKVSYKFLGNAVSENTVMAFTKTKAQASYDLNKMKIDVDSVNRKLIIRELPSPEISIIPSVEIRSIDDSFLNRVDDTQIKKVTEAAKKDAVSRVDQNKLRTEGKTQLMENLDNIFVLAKALKYTIEDETGQIDQSKL